jgi:hypothetical protein
MRYGLPTLLKIKKTKKVRSLIVMLSIILFVCQSCGHDENIYIIAGKEASKVELLTISHFKTDWKNSKGMSIPVKGEDVKFPKKIQFYKYFFKKR